MRLALTLLLAPLCAGQFQVTFTPLSPATTQRIFANGKDVDIYQIAVCANDPAMPLSIPREKVLAAASQIPVLLNSIAQDLLQRKASASGWALVARYGGLIVQYAPTGLALYGAATGTPNLTKIGLASSVGLDIGKLALSRAGDRAPDPAKYFPRFLPDFVVLSGNGCETYLAASGHSAQPVVVGPVRVDAPMPPPRAIAEIPVDVMAVWRAE